jgi:hypothetical protein
MLFMAIISGTNYLLLVGVVVVNACLQTQRNVPTTPIHMGHTLVVTELSGRKQT